MSTRVLIIDPDEDQLTTLKMALEDDGYSVDVARDGLEGLEKFREVQPSLVITELMMDRLSGFELSSRIAAGVEFRAPVIFYTGFYRDERARNEVVSKYGASGYFVKPFQIQALKRAVAQHFGEDAPTSAKVFQLPQGSRRPLADIVSRESETEREPPVPVREATSENNQDRIVQFTEPSFSRALSAAASPTQEKTSRGDRPTEQANDWFAQQPLFQVVSPLPAETPPDQPAETISAEETIPYEIPPEPERYEIPPEPERYEIPPEPESVALHKSVAEDPVVAFPSLSQSPPPRPFYRSRPFQVLAAVILLGLGFYVFRNPSSVLNEKAAVTPAQDLQNPASALPLNQAATNPNGGGNTTAPGASAEPSQSETPSQAADLLPEITSLASSETSGPSVVEQPSSSLANPGEGSATQTHGPNLVISDVTGEGGPPYLRKSKHPVVASDMVQASGNTPLVLRVVISRDGKVVEAVPLNQNESNASLSRAVLEAVQDWEFSPVRSRVEKNWIRYFSFKFTSASR